jgi:hypothetical protein
MGEQLSPSDRVTVIGSLRAVLAAVDVGELSCSAASRNRLRGAVVALESLARSDQTSVTALPEPTAQTSIHSNWRT